MIRIDSLAAFEAAPIPTAIKEYLTAYIKSVLASFGCSDLKKCSCVYYLETHQDMQKYHDMGLSQPLKDTPFECCRFIPIQSKERESLIVFHALYLRSNDFAVEVFGDKSILDAETQKAFEENTF
jgi:hypothetical protein